VRKPIVENDQFAFNFLNRVWKANNGAVVLNTTCLVESHCTNDGTTILYKQYVVAYAASLGKASAQGRASYVNSSQKTYEIIKVL